MARWKLPMHSLTHAKALILAAGKGTRMCSERPKVLHTLLGQPMLGYILDAVKSVFPTPPLVVAGHKAELVEAAFPDVEYIRQKEQVGTGHALQIALSQLEALAVSHVFVINGDAPLITSGLIRDFLHKAEDADIAFATAIMPDPGSYGRVVRNHGVLQAIIEAKDFDINAHGPASGEINAGLYYIALRSAAGLIRRLAPAHEGGEIYITDLISLGLEAGLAVRGIPMPSPDRLLGVNSPMELAQAEDHLAHAAVTRLLSEGVSIHAPAMARINPNVKIQPGAEIFGPCEIHGATTIAANAVVEAFCTINNSDIGAGARIKSFSHLEGAVVEAAAICGPYARLRPGAVVKKNAHVGNFVELKKTTLGEGSKANHLAYLGDAEIGPGVNIGAGAITCNYDGSNKYRTIIQSGAFIGSNAALVAPVDIGAGAMVGAGSVITHDVPENALAIGRQRQKNLARRKK